ncbi:hypothetical protein BC937DRAFT_90408 [Endogone sp. FLAS-F59071]|nr:hypothetical protein BC937DRAFT_90408 [Endogone sp. FLAS-F59071]|eukprot:RUS17109.1 hypothetical protein BC937DRAFT_90408 [Endogone sp. FLAS-F59071]
MNSDSSVASLVFPLEIWLKIFSLIPKLLDVLPFLLVNRALHMAVLPLARRKAIFSQETSKQDVITFCQKYGVYLQIVKLPMTNEAGCDDMFLTVVLNLCPNMRLLLTMSDGSKEQLSIICKSTRPDCVYFIMQIVNRRILLHQEKHCDIYPCCDSIFVTPSDPANTLRLLKLSDLSTNLSEQVGSGLVRLTLSNDQDFDTDLANLVVDRCPRLRCIHLKRITNDALYTLVSRCRTLVSIRIWYPWESAEVRKYVSHAAGRRLLYFNQSYTPTLPGRWLHFVLTPNE